MEEKNLNLGVIVGRFQVHALHDGHLDLIEHVVNKHHRVLVILGLAPVKNSITNPLDFESRKQLILERFPKVTVLYLHDSHSDEVWSKNLDSLISDNLGPLQSATLYGSRDSFIAHYTGKLHTETLESKRYISGTAIRHSISAKTLSSPDFRAGVIWSAYNRFPTSYQAVDIAVLDGDRILLGRKSKETKYRFIGGFVSPGDPSLEEAAKRELKEETGLTVSLATYIGSARIDDWRYRNEVDKIMSAMFVARYEGGVPSADDDIEEVRWFDLSQLNEIPLVETHYPLMKLLSMARSVELAKNPPSAGIHQNDLH